MSKFKVFMECTEANQCCDKAQYDEASLFEKLKIHLHILYCKPCRIYTARNRKLTALVKKANLKSCSAKEKKDWKKKINTELTK